MTTALLSVKSPSPPPLFPPSTTLTNPRIHHRRRHHNHHHKFQTHKLLITKVPSSSSSFSSYNTSPEADCPVPLDQQPVNEYQSLSTSSPFSWASGEFSGYCYRLLVTGASFALFVGLPVSWYGSVGLDLDPVQRVLGSVSSGVFVVILAVVRMYLGWAYVGNRLLSATVEYVIFRTKTNSFFSFQFSHQTPPYFSIFQMKTGWYDGQVWVKTPEVLARDRLLGSFSVKPVLGRLKNTLVSLGLSLFICIVLLVNTEGSQKVGYVSSGEDGGRVVHGVYNDESARSFEPEAFCGEPGLP